MNTPYDFKKALEGTTVRWTAPGSTVVRTMFKVTEGPRTWWESSYEPATAVLTCSDLEMSKGTLHYVGLLSFEGFSLLNRELGKSFFTVDEWTPLEWGGAAAGEMGELCNLLKKMRRAEVMDEPHDVPLEHVGDEIADVVIYLERICERLGISLTEALRRKFNVVAERKNAKVRL